MMTFDEAASKIFGKRTYDQGEHTPEEVEALLQLQHGFMGDIKNSWVEAAIYHVANTLAAEIAEKEPESDELAPSLFRNALSMGVAIGVMMERGG